jgi:hypothetical protein
MYFASAFQLSSYALLLQSIHSEIPKFKLLLLTNGIHFIKNTIKRWINIEKDECNTVNQKIDGLPDNCINKKSNGGYCFKNKKWFTRSNVLDNKKIGHTGNGSPVPNEINKRKKTGSAGLPELLCKCSLSGLPRGSRAGCSLLLRRGRLVVGHNRLLLRLRLRRGFGGL